MLDTLFQQTNSCRLIDMSIDMSIAAGTPSATVFEIASCLCI